MTVLAALNGPVPKAGVIALAALAALSLLGYGPRQRAGAMLAALVLAPVLLLADIWHSPQLAVIHRHPAEAAVGAVVLVALIAAVVRLLLRCPWLLAPLIVFALPFRVPIQAGGVTSNLLVPLYFVVTCGVLASVISAWRAPPAAPSPDGLSARRARASRRVPAAVTWLERLLAFYVVLYAIQSVYSVDFEKALQQMVFFYAPFALMFGLLRHLPWSARLLRRCLEVVAGLAIVFAFIGFVEYATKTIILNPRLVVQNDLHAYFTVNSVFFDPDIFGRFLALVMVALAAVLLYLRRTREQLIVTAVLAVLWVGLLLTLSRSSLGALLVGMGTLAALRWRPSRTLVPAGVVILVGVVAVFALPKTFGLNQGLNGASSGRAGLISGGIHMFAQRPGWGYGSGSFVTQYRREHPDTASQLAASHTIAVTIAAEQGLIGELVYVALVLMALFMLVQGARGDPARAALAAAFVALVLHTNLYADFLEDPVTWTVLGIGAALAALRTRPRPATHATAPVDTAVATGAGGA
ncbi:MAG TPA: O-antigen ligase family protein [Solirubrobacteraceae bacterium]|nr:O-antigen ligase family protein [Solirubrobacteraceae bacterium]